MNRRTFIKALSAFTAVAAVAPSTLASQPVDWTKWNDIELLCEHGEIIALHVNSRDFTYSREARAKLAELVHLNDDGLTIGVRRNGRLEGCQVRLKEWLPDRFVLGFQVQFTDSPLPSFALNGTVFGWSI